MLLEEKLEVLIPSESASAVGLRGSCSFLDLESSAHSPGSRRSTPPEDLRAASDPLKLRLAQPLDAINNRREGHPPCLE
jgi:hypothetical protein